MASIPLYLINGFLEAGKTTFLEDVLLNGDFADGQKTLLILCEEGEVEYNQSALTNLNMLSLTVDEEQQFSASFLCKEIPSEACLCGNEWHVGSVLDV